MLRKEAQFADQCRGIMGNAQQPITMLPNIYFFAQGAANLSELDRSDDEILAGLAKLLGGPPELLIPAWSYLNLPLDRLGAELPGQLRGLELQGDVAAALPGGPRKYVETLALAVESRRRVLLACQAPAVSAQDAADKIAEAVDALVAWWKLSGFVLAGNGDEPFEWQYLYPSLSQPLFEWKLPAGISVNDVYPLAVAAVVHRNTLSKPEASRILRALLP